MERWLDPPEDVDPRPTAGFCFICGCELKADDEVWESDEYVETDDGLICDECWWRYFKYLRKRM